MKRWMTLASVVVAAALPLILTSCEGGGGDDDPAVDVSGVWYGFAISQSETATVTLSQSGGSVNGTWISNFGTSGTFSGSVSGNNLSGTMDASGFRITVTGPVSGNTASGTWTDSQGNSGTYSATRR